jgi:hypothetical protein
VSILMPIVSRSFRSTTREFGSIFETAPSQGLSGLAFRISTCF